MVIKMVDNSLSPSHSVSLSLSLTLLTSLGSLPNTHSSNIRTKTGREGTELTIHRNLNGPSEAEEEEDEGYVDPRWRLLSGHPQHQALLPAARPTGSRCLVPLYVGFPDRAQLEKEEQNDSKLVSLEHTFCSIHPALPRVSKDSRCLLTTELGGPLDQSC